MWQGGDDWEKQDTLIHTQAQPQWKDPVGGQRWQDPQTQPTIKIPGYQPNVPATGRVSRLRDVVRSHRVISLVLVATLLIIVVGGAASVFAMYYQYSTVRSEAADGVKHLGRVQDLLKPETKQPSIPDTGLLNTVDYELTLAESDFAQACADAQGWGFSLAGHAPLVSGTVSSAIRLVTAADQASLGGLSLVHAVEVTEPLLHAGFFASGSKTAPLTAAMLTQITQDFETAMEDWSAAVLSARSADLSTIPTSLVSATQLDQLRQLLSGWPGIQSQLRSIDQLLKVAPTLLGVNGSERFLVELVDRGELRSTGGFIGSYGVLTLQSGQIQPFTLNDVFALDLPYIQRVGELPAPAKYSWWPFSGYGLRDSNLSCDFPSSAQYGMQQLKTERGPAVQGTIAVALPVIQSAMKVVGDVPLPEYGVTVTPQNLESLIRYYTETKAANVGSDLPPSEQLTTLHERFTAVLGKALMAKFHTANSKQLVTIGKMLLSSLHTKDLQLYFSNPAAEAHLQAEGLASAMTRGPQDGVTIVDSNTTGNKANLFTTVNYTDSVTIDAAGTATHHLTIVYNFSSASDPSMVHYLYGRYYYQTYLRIYAPSNSKLLSYSGFNGGDEQINASDEPDRQMWGGYVYVQDGVPYTLHFTWSVAKAATKDQNNHWHYQLVFQHQAESRQHLTLTVTVPQSSKPVLAFSGNLDRDQSFVLPVGK